MDLIITFLGSITIGVVSGSVYGLIALGIVLIYKTQRVVNFAQAELATVAAFAYYFFSAETSEFTSFPSLGWGSIKLGFVPVGFIGSSVLAVAVAALLSLVIERVVIRPLRDSPDVTVFVATAGVTLFIIAVAFIVVGIDPLQAESPFGAVGNISVRTFSVSPQQLLLIAALLATGAALAVLFRAAIGRALLALSQEPFAVRLAGVSVQRFSILIWVLGGVVAGIAGVAFAPGQTIVPGFVTQQALFPALTGAVLGGLNSLPGAFVGGLVVGIAQSLATGYLADIGIPGVDTVIVFLILIGILLLRPQGLLAKGA